MNQNPDAMTLKDDGSMIKWSGASSREPVSQFAASTVLLRDCELSGHVISNPLSVAHHC